MDGLNESDQMPIFTFDEVMEFLKFLSELYEEELDQVGRKDDVS